MTLTKVRVGRVGRPHALNGEILLHDCSLSPSELLAIREFSWRGADGSERILTLEAVRAAHDRLIVRFRGFEARDASAELALGELLVDPATLPDPGPDHAYAFQLIGMPVQTVDGRRLGVLEDILPTGANRVFVVRGEREWLVPATEDVLRRVDLKGGMITVALPPGLEDL
jgi:16S rRNA processing protein RimM